MMIPDADSYFVARETFGPTIDDLTVILGTGLPSRNEVSIPLPCWAIQASNSTASLTRCAGQR